MPRQKVSTTEKMIRRLQIVCRRNEWDFKMELLGDVWDVYVAAKDQTFYHQHEYLFQALREICKAVFV